MLFIDTLRAQGRIFFIYLYFPLIQVRLKVPLNMYVEHTMRVYIYTCMREYDVNDDEFFYYINRNILSIIYVCTLCVCFVFFLYLFIYFFATATNIKSLVCCIYPDIIKSFLLCELLLLLLGRNYASRKSIEGKNMKL